MSPWNVELKEVIEVVSVLLGVPSKEEDGVSTNDSL
jgi:hypothetical protein